MLIASLMASLAIAGLGLDARAPAPNAVSPGDVAVEAVRLASPQPPRTTVETLNALTYLVTRKWALFDRDGDGALDPDEWAESQFAAYALYNAGHDGHIWLIEYAEYFNGPVSHPHPPGMLRPMRVLRARFNGLDRGRKGYLVIDDFRREAMASFRLNDVNGDGRVTHAELDQVATPRRRR